MKLVVGNQKTFAFMPQFFEVEGLTERQMIVKENDILNLGKLYIKIIDENIVSE